jgi:hypothetical protein
MAKFTDSAGRDWILRLNVDLIESVRELDVDLADMTSRTFFRLADDPIMLVRVLWRLVAKQAEETAVTPADFGEALVGDAIDAASEALLEAITDFFPKRKRELFRKAAEVGKRTIAAADGLAARTMDDPATRERLARAMEALQRAELEKALTQLESATNSADFAASTPAPSVGGS